MADTNTRYYAVAGSRDLRPTETPVVKRYADRLRDTLLDLAVAGDVWVQRNGMGDGADTIFHNRAVIADFVDMYVPYLPYGSGSWDTAVFDASKIDASKRWSGIMDICEECHPNWVRGQRYAPLFVRTVAMLLGADLDDPVEFLVTAQSPFSTTGGTHFTKIVAKKYGIPVYEVLYKPTNQEEFSDWILEKMVSRPESSSKMTTRKLTKP